jgi:hypothetical protein
MEMGHLFFPCRPPLDVVIDLPHALFALTRRPGQRWPGRGGGWPTIGSHHRYTSREVLLGPVEEPCDRGLERLDILPLEGGGGCVTRNGFWATFVGGGWGVRYGSRRSEIAHPFNDRVEPLMAALSPPSGRHRYTSREVFLGPVEEPCDRGLERLDILPLVFL